MHSIGIEGPHSHNINILLEYFSIHNMDIDTLINNTASSNSNDMSSSSSSSCDCASTHPQISISDDLKLVIELVGNCNTMIAMNAFSLEDIEKRYVDSTANTNKKIDILQTQVKDLEDRLEYDIDQQQKKASTDLIKLEEEQVKVSATTKETEIIDDERLKSLTARVSSIEHLCVIRSNYNKRRRVSQE